MSCGWADKIGVARIMATTRPRLDEARGMPRTDGAPAWSEGVEEKASGTRPFRGGNIQKAELIESTSARCARKAIRCAEKETRTGLGLEPGELESSIA